MKIMKLYVQNSMYPRHAKIFMCGGWGWVGSMHMEKGFY